METELGSVLDGNTVWDEDTPEPVIAEFPFVTQSFFKGHQRCILIDNVNTQNSYAELGLTPSHEDPATQEVYIIHIKATTRTDFYNIVAKIRECLNTSTGADGFNKLRLVDLAVERNYNSYYGRGVVQGNKAGFSIYV